MPAYTATAAKNTSRRAPYTVPARNESTGLIERIAVSTETKMKFKDVGKPRKVVKPNNIPLIKRITTPEERFKLNRAFDQDLIVNRCLPNTCASNPYSSAWKSAKPTHFASANG